MLSLLGCHVFHLCIVFILSTTIPILGRFSPIVINLDHFTYMTVDTNLVEQIALAGDYQDDNEHNQPGGHTSNELSLAKQSAQKIIWVILHLQIISRFYYSITAAHL